MERTVDQQATEPVATDVNSKEPVVIHMASGITLITKVKGIDENGWHLHKPCEFGVRKTGPSSFQIGFSRYLSLSGFLQVDDDLVLPEHLFIDVVTEFPELLYKGYLEFISGIALPPKGAAASVIAHS